MDKIVVQIPTDEQLIVAVRLAVDMWKESPMYNNMDISESRMIAYAMYVRDDAMSFVRIAVSGDSIVGFFVGQITHNGFHNSYTAFDRMVYVTPARRGSVAASVLITAFEDWCRTKNVSRIMLGTTTGVRANTTEKLYNRMGYDTVGALTMKECL